MSLCIFLDNLSCILVDFFTIAFYEVDKVGAAVELLVGRLALADACLHLVLQLVESPALAIVYFLVLLLGQFP